MYRRASLILFSVLAHLLAPADARTTIRPNNVSLRYKGEIMRAPFEIADGEQFMVSAGGREGVCTINDPGKEGTIEYTVSPTASQDGIALTNCGCNEGGRIIVCNYTDQRKGPKEFTENSRCKVYKSRS